MPQDNFDTGFGALAHPNPRTLPFVFDQDNSPVSLPPPPPTRGHQRSRTATDLPPLFTRAPSFSPTASSTFSFLRPGSTRSLSPERVTPAEADEFALQEPLRSPTKRKSSGLAAWFEGGSSAPVNIGIVSTQKEKLDSVQEGDGREDSFSMTHDPIEDFTQRPQRKSISSTSASSTMSKFNIFRRNTVVPATEEDMDGLVQLNVQDALFPRGRPDEFSPAAFKNLELNAEGTIQRFQQAHKDQQQSLRSAVSTKNVQADELEAAETRNEHLKLQLQEMAERAAEQERLITSMRSELAAHRSSLESHRQSPRIIPYDREKSPRPNARRNRISDASITGESDDGFSMSSAASIFSERLSIAPSHATSMESSPSDVALRAECTRCHGMRPNDAWDVVEVMKIESDALKQRIAILESAQDDAMDLINGLKLSF